MAEHEGYSHCPEDVIDAIAKYESDVASGVIVPWNKDTRDEYCDPTGKDEWLISHIEMHMPEAYTGYNRL